MGVRLLVRKYNVARPEQVKRRIANVLNDGAQEGVVIAKTLVHVVSGELRDSIEQQQIATPDNLKADFVATAPHAIFEEYGTVNRPAHPFMHPAKEQADRQVKQNLKGVIR